MTRLAIRPEQLTAIAEIADSYDISENHLMKVIYRLGLAAYVETVRGRNGGVRQLKRPAEINIGEIVRRIEPDFDLVPCFSTSNSCAIEPACVLKALGEAHDAFLSALARHTMADLIGRPFFKSTASMLTAR
ncbi:MAG: Rrf2 family transcriptional regulator [Xanthobacteraceae bacterium]